MHLILLHGYLLQGTGSNIYVANIAKAWQKQGHAVTILCQDPKAKSLAFVDQYIGPEEKIPSHPPNSGQIRVVVPDINGLLPVYVFDHYEGYTVKTIPEMTVKQCENHIELTSTALRKVADQGASLVLANHALFGPLIARRGLAGNNVPYDVKVHGSAVEYTLVPHPDLMHYAVDGLQHARRIFVGTQYVKHRLQEVFASHQNILGLDDKLHIVPPGMDPGIFKLAEKFETNLDRFLEKVHHMIQENGNGRHAKRIRPPTGKIIQNCHKELVHISESYDQRAIDADLPAKWPKLESQEPIILYFGKFLAAKGVGEVLLTVPMLLSKIPQARFVFVGFGSYREHMEGMIQGLTQGDRQLFLACAKAGDFVETPNVDNWFRPLTPQEGDRITVTGILDHEALGHLLPLASLTIVPSKWPEAFGMVAVEAMAAGVLPLCNDHAGLRDVIETVHAESPEISKLMRLDRAEFVEQLPEKIESALNFLYPNGFNDHSHRRKVSLQLRRISMKQFSWDGIAKQLL
jgi:glycosyltransferase involved in cell wall biosynthesis